MMSDHTWDWLLTRLWLKKQKNSIKYTHTLTLTYHARYYIIQLGPVLLVPGRTLVETWTLDPKAECRHDASETENLAPLSFWTWA